MERARVNGVVLEYELKGSGEPVLLIHGSHICRSFLPLLAQPLLTEKYTLIRYHRRGFLGSTPARGPISIKDQAADARALLEYLHVSPAHIVGHSYGGSIALQLAADFPACVHSLVLLEAPLTSVPHWKAVRELNAAAMERYRQGDWEAAVDAFLGSPAERAAVARNVPGGLEQAMRDLDTYFGIEAPAHEAWQFTEAEGKQITRPVLFIRGSESQVLYVECRDQIQQWIPQTESVVLRGATHLLHMQQPAGAATLMVEFFTRYPIVPLAPPHPRRRWRSDHYNATTDLLDGNLEQGRFDKVAIKTQWGEWTYADVAIAANRAGNAFRELGVEAENRVLMAVLDSPEFAATFFGAIKLGAVPVPVNTSLSSDEYAYLLNDSRAKIAVVSEPVAEVFRTIRYQSSYLRQLVIIGEAAPGELSFEEIIRNAAKELHSDITLSASKLHFAYGLGNGLYFPFAVGATTVLAAEPALPRLIFEAIRRFRPTIYFASPTSFANVLAAPASSWKAADFSSVRACVSAGEPLPRSVLTRWKEKTGIDILDGIGTTESCHIFISNRLHDIRPDCSGTVVEGYEVRVTEEEGRDVPLGQPGMLMVKGDSICAFYWGQRQLTRETILGEWLKTGDICVKDASDHFFYRGRSDDMLKVGGMWVSPYEVEVVLCEDESVGECAVVGVLDRDNLIKPEAFVVLAGTGGGQELEDRLRQHVRQRLGGNKTPRAFHFVESLPKTATGKVQRFKLRELAQLD
jgi:acyl-coenzyme A synthetase/AMP-(fatty) acid ligase/pimeloyl-ACP methyl ester carboxylesterase